MKEVIRHRQSIRSFNGDKLTSTDQEKIQKYINDTSHLIGPYGNSIKLEYVDRVSNEGIKIGTYGFIKGQAGFIVGVCKNTTEALLDYGYVFEKLILFLTKEGLGTCWLGGTFTRKTLNMHLEMKENEIIPAITPVGYAKDNRRFTDKLIRKVAKSNQRLPYEDLFYEHDFSHPLKDVIEACELVQLGPSASNKQPWRLVLDGDTTHFYIKRTKNYSKGLSYDMQLLDIGIAMCHYDVGYNYKGKWIEKDPQLVSEDKEYIISYQL